METRLRPWEFPPSHLMLSVLRDSRQAEGEGNRGWGCRRGNPTVSEGPKGPGKDSCGCVGDRHSSVALWVKIAQREVGSFHMNKACF